MTSRVAQQLTWRCVCLRHVRLLPVRMRLLRGLRLRHGHELHPVIVRQSLLRCLLSLRLWRCLLLLLCRGLRPAIVTCTCRGRL